MFFFFAILIIAFGSANAQFIPFGFWAGGKPPQDCESSPAGLSAGDKCDSGTIYLGTFDGGAYMTTPSGCSNSSTPVCSGGIDTVRKTWRGSSGSNVDIVGVETVGSAPTASSSSFRGNVNTPAIVAEASVSSDSAADFCDQMVFASYSDWYLPSKSELSFLYCLVSSTTHQASYPQDDADCFNQGGKSPKLRNFAPNYYWSSTEQAFDSAWRSNFNTGFLASNPKTGNYFIRCIRRF